MHIWNVVREDFEKEKNLLRQQEPKLNENEIEYEAAGKIYNKIFRYGDGNCIILQALEELRWKEEAEKQLKELIKFKIMIEKKLEEV